jgi:hypothetical protein
MVAGAQQQYPQHRFKLTDGPDAHNDRVRFTWTMFTPDETPLAVGVDFARVADDGRLSDVTGFLQPA